MNRRSWFLSMAALTSMVILILLYLLVRGYVHSQVEKRVRDTMLETRAFHQYVQNDMHPAYYKLMAEGYLKQGFYAPELLSSSFIARNMQQYYNKERREAKLPEVTYKIASGNPRNSVNKATEFEQKIINWFNQDKTRTSYREIIKENGKKYLLYAQPFIPVKPGCLKCHGDPEDAPQQLREKYDWTGAWNLNVGDIIAAEFIRSPLEGEYNFTTIIMGGTALFLGICLALFMFNNRLSTLVDQRTAALHKTEIRRESIAAERELALQRLAEERQRYADVLEGANVGTWDWNLNTKKIVYNDKCTQILGYTPKELSHVTTQTWEDQCHPDDKLRVTDLLKKHMAGERIHYDCTFRMAHKEGHWIWVHERGRVILRSDKGLPLRMSGIRTDITEKIRMKEKQEKLEEKYRQAQKVESVGRLAGGVAHDLNNLLSPVIGYGEMLMEDLGPEDLTRDSIKKILHAGYSARDLVRQLLAFSRKQTMSFENVDLNQVVKDFGKLLRRTIREDIEVELMLSPDIEMVKADIGQIEQVIMNLAVNASDAMPDGGRLSIETSMKHLDESYAASRPGVTPGEYVLLAVSDTGCGMDAKILENIFEPFFSTKGEKGTGLGLATVYGIVKQHGGNIWVYSESDRGTSFKVYLPVTNEVNNLKKFTKKDPLNLKGSETILLVEDDKMVRQLSQTILERQGYNLLVANDGLEALSLLKSYHQPIHMLLTDVIMPRMNGRELHEKIIQHYPDLKVLYMSGYTGNVISHHGVLDEGVKFIQKPFSVEDLLYKVREVLEGSA